MLYAVPWNFEKEKGHMMNGKTLVLLLAFELKSTTSIVKRKLMKLLTYSQNTVHQKCILG